MEIKIDSQEDNKLFNRKEIKGEISHSGEATPKRAQVRELLAAKLSVDKSVVSIRTILSTFGGKTKLAAMIYDSKESLDKTEPKYVIKRNPEPKVEAPAEEPKEEVTEALAPAEQPAEATPTPETK